MALGLIVQLQHRDRQFTFHVDCDPPLTFWRVESEGRVYRSPLHVSGNEQPGFFQALADAAILQGL